MSTTKSKSRKLKGKNILSTKSDKIKRKQKNKEQTQETDSKVDINELDNILEDFDNSDDLFSGDDYSDVVSGSEQDDMDNNSENNSNSEEIKHRKNKQSTKKKNTKPSNTKPHKSDKHIKQTTPENKQSTALHTEDSLKTKTSRDIQEEPTLQKLYTVKQQSHKLKPPTEPDLLKIYKRIIRAENINTISTWKNTPNTSPKIQFDNLVKIRDKDYSETTYKQQKSKLQEYINNNKDQIDKNTLEFDENMKPIKRKHKKEPKELSDILRNTTMAISLKNDIFCYSDKHSRKLFLDTPLVADKNVQLYTLKRELQSSYTNISLSSDQQETKNNKLDENNRLIVKNYVNGSGDRDIRYEIGVYQAIRNTLLTKGYETYKKTLMEEFYKHHFSEVDMDTLEEIEKISKDKAQKLVYRVLPYFSSSYMMFGKPVLILELLDKLDDTDDPYAIGFEIIHHLLYIHTIGVHNDIKPENIMKITRMSEGKKRVFYYLIDYGGLTNEKYPDGGYRRFVWSPKWTSQIKPGWYRDIGKPELETETVRKTSPRFDFIELGITMRVFQITSKLSKIPKDIEEEYLHDFTKYKGRLRKYMEYVLALPNSEKYDISVYKDLQDILSPED